MKITKNKKVYEENIAGKTGKVSAIVFPDSIQELKNVIRLTNLDIVPRGAGTSFSLGCFPNPESEGSVIIDLSKMKKIVDINPGKRTVIVQPGATVKEINEELNNFGLEFPIIPFFSGIETIGGIISKNTAGSREIKYGRAMSWVESLEIIDGKGEQIKASKSDISDFVGMEGTTGIIIQATLRLTAKRKRTLTILKSDNLDFIINANKKLRLEHDISSIDFFNKQISSLLGFEEKYHLFVEYESEKGLFKDKEYEKYFKLKSKAYNKIANEGFYLVESIKVSPESLLDFLDFLEKNKIPYFGHIASGVIYCCFGQDEKEDKKREETLNFARKQRSIISYGFGYGLTNKSYLSIEDKKLIKRIKARHDPLNKFNRGKLIDAEDIVKEIEVSKKLGSLDIEDIEKKIEEKQAEPQEEIDKLVEQQIKREEELKELAKEPIQREEEPLSEEQKKEIANIAFGFSVKPKAEEKAEEKLEVEEEKNEKKEEEKVEEKTKQEEYIG